ncbi:TetR/AcrR family transcriptional regulator [Brevibacillus fulvus]|uniref:AcrR family transcriptional regulator n=1 Tax=Brevibacillus fulvus TaxID=1125967 RepID=A0A939BRE9_9BACL|nr:TetR/AcrR family transcriptional regulator [Brevibacillus fulvus]MBM7589547.1 AcrR family transcriptional regulator [Brevibacillus fulvus]
MTNEFKEQIITAFYELAMQRGFARVEMTEVCRQLNLEPEALSQLYPDREALVEDCVMKFFENIDKQISPLLADSQLDTLSKWNRITTVVSKNLEQISLEQTLEFQQHFPELWEKVNVERKKRIGAYERLFAQGIREGVFRPYPPRLIVRLYFLALQECSSTAWLRYDKLTLADSLKKMQRLLLYGLLSPKLIK